MAYSPTEADYYLLDQPVIQLYLKIEIKNDDGTILDILQGLIGDGSLSIDASSDVRRTATFSIVPIKNETTISNGVDKNVFDLSERSLIWLNKTAVYYCGIYNFAKDEITWYKLGTFKFQSTDITYDAVTNQMSVTCSDYMTMLDGTLNGQVGQLTTVIPAYKEDSTTGEVLEYYYIKNAMLQVLSQFANITGSIVDDIGEFKGMKQYNLDWKTYRAVHPLWDNVPYDLEFSSGTTIAEILGKLRDLYPNYEMYFDEDGVFHCNMIPSCYYDEIYLSNDTLQKYLISEQSSRDFSEVKNICEVWGEALETDFFSDSVMNSDGSYTATIEGLDEEYKSGDRVALKVPSTNITGQSININGLGAIVIYDEDTESPLEEGFLEPNKIYVFQCKKLHTSKGADEIKFWYIGEYQIHAMSVLTDGTVVKAGWTDPDTGRKIDLYSKEYYQVKHDCQYVDMTVIPESPFCIQKIGEILDVKTGGEYEDITSDTLAMARAHYDNWINSRLTDSINITTLIMPFLDVNKKVMYKPANSDTVNQYIIKSVNHDFASGTSTISMMTFYPLYEDMITLGGYTNGGNVTVVGTQEFMPSAYESSSVKNTQDLTRNDYVWLKSGNQYQTFRVVGFGEKDEKVNGRLVEGIPYVSRYEGASSNLNNFLLNSSYKVSTVDVPYRSLQAAEFTYNMYDSNNQIVSTGKCSDDGTIIFDPISFTSEDIGAHAFTVRQVVGSDNSVAYDQTEWTVNIIVSLNSNGGIVAEGSYDITFKNQYS